MSGSRGPIGKAAPQRSRVQRRGRQPKALGGGSAKAPKPPGPLGKAGRRWWTWAWRTPAASQWGESDLYAVGRRAVTEDLLEALPGPSSPAEVKAITAARCQLLGRAQAEDTVLGLNPASRARLNWAESPRERPSGLSGSTARDTGRAPPVPDPFDHPIGGIVDA